MKRTVKILYIVLIIILIRFLTIFAINKIFISNYNKEIYKEKMIKSLLILNISEPYIAHYNYGNVLYKNNNFDKAIEEYEKALKLFPPKKKECSIRINLALAMLGKVDEENKTKYENLEILEQAKEVLCEEGCANKTNDKGHSKKAQKLKEDIDEWIKKFEKQEEKKEDNKDKKEDNKEQKDNQNERKEQQLKEIQSQAIQQRQDELEKYKVMNEYQYYNGKTW